MESRVALVGIACATVLIPGSSTDADFSHVEIEIHEAPGCPATFRFYARFTDSEDQLLAVSGAGGDQHLYFSTNHELFNDGGPIGGLRQEDTAAAPVTGPQDSWVTIGAVELAGNDTSFSPGFAGGDGVHSVINGFTFSEENGGWFDSDPGTPVTGTRIIIAQFSMVTTEPHINFRGFIDWKTPAGQLRHDYFDLEWHVDGGCEWNLDFEGGQWGAVDIGDLLILLAQWGPCPTECCRADFDGDGDIGFGDLLIMLVNWGPCF